MEEYPFVDDGRSSECDHHLPNTHVDPFVPGSFSLKRIENHEVDSDEEEEEEVRDSYAQSQAHRAATRSGRRRPKKIAGVPKRVGGTGTVDDAEHKNYMEEEEEFEQNEHEALLGAERV